MKFYLNIRAKKPCEKWNNKMLSSNLSLWWNWFSIIKFNIMYFWKGKSFWTMCSDVNINLYNWCGLA